MTQEEQSHQHSDPEAEQASSESSLAVREGSAFAAITMKANCLENAAIFAYVNGADIAEILRLMTLFGEVLSDQDCAGEDIEGRQAGYDFVALSLEGCSSSDECGAGFECRRGRCRVIGK